MQRRLASLRLTCALGLLSVVALEGCTQAGKEAPAEPGAEDPATAGPGQERASEELGEQPGPGEDQAIGATVGKELPPELVAELRLQGSDADGRLLTLAPGFIATAECSDCGAPSYLWFLAVRCTDERHCEVLTEQCEGSIRRDADVYQLEFHPVEGGTTPEVCAGYSGTFEQP